MHSIKFGRLTALYKIHKSHKKNVKWLCLCDCGNLVEVFQSNLAGSKTKSCGCLNKEVLIDRLLIHGKSCTRLYHIWQHIVQRCTNKNAPNYKDYGARGITVCKEWLNDKTKFFKWAIDNNYRDDLTIDRIDVNGDYEPSNCKWSTKKQQARNRRTNKMIVYNGETHCLSEWCEILGLNYNKVKRRLQRGWSTKKAFTTK